MALYDYLLEQYGFNEPILTTEIQYRDYSKPWLYKEINRLVKDGKLMKFDKGICYIPKDTPFGKSILNPNKVIEKKYINDGSGVIGYYSGISFLNMIGMSSQVANRIEIYTNKETSKFREVSVGRQRVILRRARVNITEKNAPVLSLLEMMNFVSPDIKEGEFSISHIWLSIHRKKLATEGITEITDDEIYAKYPLPYELDFRMH